MTVADRIAAGLVPVAGAVAAWSWVSGGGAGVGAAGIAGVTVVVVALQARTWARSCWAPRLTVERDPAGALQFRVGDGAPWPAMLGPGTRRVGSTIVLDLRYESGGRCGRCRRWLTPLDVSAEVLRRWAVVLPDVGSAACS